MRTRSQSSRWVCAVLAGALAPLLGACATAGPPKTPPLDALMGCPVQDAALTSLPEGMEDAPPGRSLAIPEALRRHLRRVASLRAGERAPCTGIDPARVVAPEGKGSVRWAIVAKVVEPLVVWRAFGAAGNACSKSPARLGGSWWSAYDPRERFGAGEAGKTAYRKAAAVCSAWNDFGLVARCTVQPGAIVAVGPTQSVADCGCTVLPGAASESYGANDEWQVYINLFHLNQDDVMKCEQATGW